MVIMKYIYVILMVVLFQSCYITKGAQSKSKTQIKVKGIISNMIYDEPGTFTMGATSEEDYDERVKK